MDHPNLKIGCEIQEDTRNITWKYGIGFHPRNNSPIEIRCRPTFPAILKIFFLNVYESRQWHAPVS